MHCLNLKITYECTNNCPFCFSSYLKDDRMSVDGMKKALQRGWQIGCEELVISGGEPTLKPDIITELMSDAEELGYKKYIIQTNGTGLSDSNKLIAFLNDVASKKEVCISFSVHGCSAETHDTMSRRNGAYRKLMNAIENIANTHCKIYTNTVMSSLNINSLKGIVDLLSPFKPEIIQFSMMHTAEPLEYSIGLKDAVFAIQGLKDAVDLDVLKTEGIPYCLLHGMEQCVGESYWPHILDIYNKEDSYMQNFSQLNYGMRYKEAFCAECVMNTICMGVWSENRQEFHDMGIKPIS